MKSADICRRIIDNPGLQEDIFQEITHLKQFIIAQLYIVLKTVVAICEMKVYDCSNSYRILKFK